MKKLKTDTGVGYPIRLDTLNYMSNAMIEVVAAICKSYGAIANATDGLLLTGSKAITTSPHQVLAITDAYIFFNGEIYFCPAQSLQASDDVYPYWHFVITSTDDLTGTYKDGVNRATTVIRTLTLATRAYGVALPEGALDHTAIILPSNVWCSRNGTMLSSQVTLESGWAHNAGNPVRRKIDDIGQLKIIGQFKVDGSPNNILFTLPEGLRPSIEQTFTIFAKATQYGIAEKPINVTVATSGNVTISQYEVFSDGYYCFCNTILI